MNRRHRVSYLVSSHLADLAATTGADVVGQVHAALDAAPPDIVLYDIGGMVAWDTYHQDMAEVLAALAITHIGRHSTTGWRSRAHR